jgi:flagellar L-ring protein precursor FlgH
MSARRPLAVLLALAALAAPGAVPGAAAQSLWREGAAGANLFADNRARAVNDIVTIIVAEQSSSSRTANTKTSKDSTRTAAINEFPGLALATRNAAVAPYLKYDVANNASHEGKGEIDRTDTVTARIAARVVKVLDNGLLLIEGRRSVLVNDETQVLTISGLVRPQDITGSNTVLSSQIADAEIQMVGRGVLAEAQRPGLLYRLLDWLHLF